MSVRIVRTGTGVVKDHQELANKGIYTHAEIDSYLQEMDDARENKPSLKVRFDDLIKKDDEQDRRLNGITDGVTSIQGALNSVTNKLIAVEATNQVQDSRLSQIEQKNLQQDQAISKLQGDASSNPNAEVVAARKDRNGKVFPSLKSRLDDMQSKIGTGGNGGSNGGTSSNVFDLQTPINLLLNTFRDAEAHNKSAYRQNNLYIDVFNDSSGIDLEKSSSFGILDGTVSTGVIDTNIIMAGPDLPAPYHVTSSSESSSYPGWMGMNGNMTDYYYSNGLAAPAEGHWWKIDFGVAKIISKIAIAALNITSGWYSVASFTVQGSHDDENWTDIYEGTQPNTKTEIEHHFLHSTAYRYYRIAKLRSHVSSSPVIYTGWHEIKLYEVIDSVTLVTKAIEVNRSPNKLIVTAEYTGSVTFDITLDGTNWNNNVDLNKLLDISTLQGSRIQIRANIPVAGTLKSLGFTWYDDSMLLPIPGNSGGTDPGNPSVTKPLVDVVAATNILRNVYRTLKNGQLGPATRHHLYADAFTDISGVDIPNSSSFQVANGRFTKTTGEPYSWELLNVQTASSVGDYFNNNTTYRPFKKNGTTSVYAVEKIADDSNVSEPAGNKDYWLASGSSADLFIKWETPVSVPKIILWMNNTYVSGHNYCDHQIFVKNPSSGQWEAVSPRVNLSSVSDKGVHGDGSWHYPISVDYLINEVKVTVWNKGNFMTVTEIQILHFSDEDPVLVSKPIKLDSIPTHLILDAEYEGKISVDLSLDGGVTYKNNVGLNQLIDLRDFTSGTSVVMRAKLSEKSVLQGIGFIWYDKDTLPTYTASQGSSSGGNESPGMPMLQIEKLGVIATPTNPEEVNITIPPSKDFKLPPVEVLKFVPGPTDQVRTAASFNPTDAGNYDADEKHVIFDGKMHLQTTTVSSMSLESILPSGRGVYSLAIKLDEYVKIEKLEVK